jgi:hypothetical protein
MSYVKSQNIEHQNVKRQNVFLCLKVNLISGGKKNNFAGQTFFALIKKTARSGQRK